MKLEVFAVVDEAGRVVTHDTHQMYGGHGVSFPGLPLLFACREDAEAYIAHAKLDQTDESAQKFKIEEVTISGREEYPCQACGKSYPPRYLFDLKGSVPGGCKETCLECKGMLDEREACAKLTVEHSEDHASERSCTADDIAEAIRARTTITSYVDQVMLKESDDAPGLLESGWKPDGSNGDRS